MSAPPTSRRSGSAEKIVELAYANSSAVYFTTGGAESNESAFKTARFYWKVQGKPDKIKIISRIHAYHGVTMAAMSATGMAAYQKMFGPLMPGFVQVPAPYPYRWQGNQECGIGAAEAVEEAILREGPDTVAAFIAEPVMGAGGVIVPPDGYFPSCARSATSTTCCSSPTRSSPASAAPAAGSRSATGTSSPTSCPSPRA